MIIQNFLQFKGLVLLGLTISGMATFGLLALAAAARRRSPGGKRGPALGWYMTAAVGALLLAPPAYEGAVGGLTGAVLRVLPDVGNVALADQLMRASMAEAGELRERAEASLDACRRERRGACERVYESEMMRIKRKIKRAERAAIEVLGGAG